MTSRVTHLYSYDISGNRIRSELGHNGLGGLREILSQYDDLGRLKSVTERNLGQSGPTRTTTYSHDANGNVLKKELPNGLNEAATYDALNRRRVQMVRSGETAISVNEQFYDRNGNVRVIQEVAAGEPDKDRVLEMAYDLAGRLTQEITKVRASDQDPWVEVARTKFSYDAANNRTWKKRYLPEDPQNPAETWESVYNARNQLTSYTHRVGTVVAQSTTYAYDDSGRRTARTRGGEKIEYAYEPHNDLLRNVKRRNLNYNTVEENYWFLYDHRGRRTGARRDYGESGNGWTIATFSGGTSVREIASGNGEFLSPNYGSAEVDYVRGSDWGGGTGGMLYSLRPGLGTDEPRFSHANGRGDIVLQTDGNGQKLYDAAYEAFGTRTRESGLNPDRQRANTKEEET